MLSLENARARSSGDRAPDSGSGCRGFKSLRARICFKQKEMGIAHPFFLSPT